MVLDFTRLARIPVNNGESYYPQSVIINLAANLFADNAAGHFHKTHETHIVNKGRNNQTFFNVI